MTTAPPPPLRIGILGTAKIARAFVYGVRSSRKLCVDAVASRDGERAAAFARETGVVRAHASYEALLADSAIDAVYVPLPNSLHAEWSIRAAETGKHVLCEKPLATSEREARAMFDAARRHGVALVEAYPYRAQPQTLQMRALLAKGEIGRVQLVHASFGFPLPDAPNIRLDPALAGGALMDAGCYPVSLARMVVGERPLRVHAFARRAASGVDRTLVASLEFPGGVLAQVACSFGTMRHRHAFVAGDTGSIATTFLNDTGPANPPVLELVRGAGRDRVVARLEAAAVDGFLAEAESFADLVAHGPDHWTGASPDESIDIAATLSAIAESARRGVPVDVPREP